MNRAALVAEISRRLEGRSLVWFGTRGDDIESVADVPELTAAFSLIAPYDKRPSIDAMALETLSEIRVDLDAYDVDEELHAEATTQLRRALLSVLSRPSALFTYRPSTFASAICFARRDRCRYLGLFKDHQSAFEHKPWVETSVGGLGIPQIPWSYIADEDQLETLRVLADGPVMLRRSRTNGGVGLARLDRSGELDALWPHGDEAYVSVAPFIADALPVNVGAVVWHDGVTLHPPSVQLIGVPQLTARPFGYCGNDFGAVRQLESAQLDRMDTAVMEIGRWLSRHGYRGAFGVDFLVTSEGVPLFTEVNPRFQGSTHASCQLSVQAGESCLLLEHLAALLDIDAPRSRRLAAYAADAEPFAHFVVHSLEPQPTRTNSYPLLRELRRHPGVLRGDVLVTPEVVTHPGATIARVTVADELTQTGFDLADPWRSILAGATPANAAVDDDVRVTESR
jgi:hypothetical protein